MGVDCSGINQGREVNGFPHGGLKLLNTNLKALIERLPDFVLDSYHKMQEDIVKAQDR